jgi:hypothetical protein
MRSSVRRARRVKSLRRTHSPLSASVVVEPESVRDEEDPGALELDGDEGETDDREKIEVHVHLHRGKAGKAGAKKKKRKPPRPVLRGALFDWKGHYDVVCKPPAPPADGSAHRRSLNCSACGAVVPRFARNCRRCDAPQPRGIMARLAIAIGLASVVGVFALCSYLLGDSAREQRTPEPLRKDFTDEEAIVVEVPSPPSPFSYQHPPQRPPQSPDK